MQKDSNISRPDWLMYNPNTDDADDTKLKMNTSAHQAIMKAR